MESTERAPLAPARADLNNPLLSQATEPMTPLERVDALIEGVGRMNAMASNFNFTEGGNPIRWCLKAAGLLGALWVHLTLLRRDLEGGSRGV